MQTAKLSLRKSADHTTSYVGDVITYQLMVENTGNLPAGDVVLTHALTVGTEYVSGSLLASVPVTGDPDTGIALTNPVAPNETIAISFQIRITAVPNPNPIWGKASAVFIQGSPDAFGGEYKTAQSNTVRTLVFSHPFRQQISDLIHSVALEQAALVAIIHAEGAKIQRMVATNNLTSQEFLRLNKSMTDMMDSVAMLENVLKQKLSVVDCRLIENGC